MQRDCRPSDRRLSPSQTGTGAGKAGASPLEALSVATCLCRARHGRQGTPLGERRVSARRGWAGEKIGFVSILLGVALRNSIQLGQPHRRLTIAWRAIVASRR